MYCRIRFARILNNPLVCQIALGCVVNGAKC
nr:MAG TPA: hypothetical protein [Caudoviricetes sp.]